jgi:mannose-6-phosphate isomerase-like protein (cupin superfamily)
MKIVKVQETDIKETPHKIDARELYNKETAQVVHIELKPDESLKPHKTPVDVFFYILEGTPDIFIGDEKQTVEKDSLVESPKNITHYFSNNSENTVRVLVVKAPNPTAQTKLL